MAAPIAYGSWPNLSFNVSTEAALAGCSGFKRSDQLGVVVKGRQHLNQMRQILAAG